MITAERLKELIKQGAKIWVVNSISVYDLDLIENENTMISIGISSYGKSLCYSIREKDDCGLVGNWEYSCFRLESLFETIEQAEWAYKTIAERTERFEPPMWEDIEVIYTFKFINDNECMSLIANKKYNFVAISNGLTVLFEEKYTKENYEKACEIVRDLFNKGGAK